MTTFDKNFVVKNGIVVNSTVATVNGNQVLTEASSINALNDVTITSATTGQVLKYNGTIWVNDTDEAGGGGGLTVSDTAPVSPSEGDLWYKSNTGRTYVRYDSYWVEIDTSQKGDAGPTGPSVGSMGGYESGAYYSAPHVANANSTTHTLNRQFFFPFYVSTTTTFDRIGCRSGASYAGTQTVRLGIYNNGTNVPTTVVLDAGTVSPSGTSQFNEITISQELATGWYWLSFNIETEGAGATRNYNTFDPIINYGYARVGTNLNRVFTRYQDGITGAFATVDPANLQIGQSTNSPVVLLRAV